MWLVRKKTYLNNIYYYVQNNEFDDYEEAQKQFLQDKNDLLEENDFEEFVGQDWNDENINALDQALKEEGMGGAEKDYVEIDGGYVSLEKINS